MSDAPEIVKDKNARREPSTAEWMDSEARATGGAVQAGDGLGVSPRSSHTERALRTSSFASDTSPQSTTKKS